MKSLSKHRPLAFLLGALALLAVPTVARAQDRVKEIREKNRAAMEEFDLNEFPSAKAILEEALELARKNKLDKHPIAAETHMYLAIVNIAGMQDELEGIVEFVKALEINPQAQVPVDYKTPEVTKVFEKAKARAPKGGGTGTGKTGGGGETGGGETGGGGKTGGGGEKPAAPEKLDCSTVTEGILHSPVNETTAGKDLKIELCLGAEIGASNVIIYYRPMGVEAFTPQPAKNQGGGLWSGTIKGGAIGGEYIHYYIEARNTKNVALVRSGAKDSPNIVEVLQPDSGGGGGGGEGGEAIGSDNENPLDPGGGGGGDDDDPDEHITKGGGGKKKGGGIYIAVAAGSGAGLLTGGNLEVAEETADKKVEVNPGVAPAAFHVHGEAGYYMNPKTMIGVFGRFQVVTLADIKGGATGAIAGGLRFRRNLAPRTQSHVYVHLDAGGGQIRHVVSLEKPPMADPEAKKDTALQGMILIGGGAGYALSLGGAMSMIIETNILAGIPVGSGDSFAINADLNLGVGLSF